MKKQKENDKKAQEPVGAYVNDTEEKDELVRLPDRLADEVIMHVNKGKLAQKIRELHKELEEVTEQRNEVERDWMRLKEFIAEQEREITDIKNAYDDAIAELKINNQENIKLHKTISKMQQEHEAEVQDLKDQLGEAKAAEAAAKKAHARAVGEKNDYADALDDDSIAFEEILGLAILMERGAKSMHEVSKMIQEKTEGRI